MNDALDERLGSLATRLHDSTADGAGDLDDVYRRRHRDDRRRRATAVAGVVAAMLVGAVVLTTARGTSPDSQRLDTSGGPSPGPGPSAVITAEPATGIPSPTDPDAAVPPPVAPPGPSSVAPADPGRAPSAPSTTAAPAVGGPRPGAGYQLLWPFASADDAAAWQVANGDGGHQPWLLDPAATALSFTNGFLGIGDVDRALDTRLGGTDGDAHVTVGFLNPNGAPVRVAIVHVVRLGTGPGAPWEAVGTDDTLGLSLDTPRYGSTVTSPVAVGGRITGVDESIRVRALQADGGPVGETPGVPAGGEDTPWSSTVAIAARDGGTVTIVASTGGHLAGVERFAVTGVRVGP
jgi:hypothetical protein